MTKKELAAALYDMTAASDLEIGLLPPFPKDEFVNNSKNMLKKDLERRYNEFIADGYGWAIKNMEN